MSPNFNLWLIPALPLAGGAINGLLGRRYSHKVVTRVALLACGAAFAWAVVCAFRFAGLPEGAIPHIETYATWLRAGNFSAPFAFMLDQLSLVMILVVTGVGFLIHIYSVGYMAEEGGYYRFFSYLNLFMFFMLTLVLANNYLLLFVGWEGVGLASYLLIGFFFQRDSAASAGKKAFIVNRIGDFGFLIGLFLMIQHFGSLTFSDVFAKVSAMPIETAGAGLLTTIGLLLMFGACGKSAQLPLYVWLPDAMEGPTPVSALIHAATMVTAGVYMVARSNPIYFRSPTALTAVAVIGTVTAFYAATIAIAQTDIKRVLAYSTISQLGYMFVGCGVAAFGAGIFHLMTHAFFKALLFLGAGSVIHALGGEQDMRRMGGLRKHIPWTFWSMTMATLAIAGIPGFSGFFSKDQILWDAYASPWNGHWAFWSIGCITAGITSFYMFRLWFLTFWGEFRGPETVGEHASHGHAEHATAEHGHIHESPKVMTIPLAILAVLSVIGGYIGVPEVLHGANLFGHFLDPVFHAPPVTQELAERGSHALELLLMGGSIAASLIGLFFAWLLYYRRPELPGRIAAGAGMLYRFVLNKYYVDEFYGAVFVKPLIEGSKKLWLGIDTDTIDGALNGSAHGAQEVSDGVRQIQSGNIRSYAAWVTVGAVAVLIFMIVMGVK
jgi:NADH-quinone oxidoreductase subunit L